MWAGHSVGRVLDSLTGLPDTVVSVRFVKSPTEFTSPLTPSSLRGMPPLGLRMKRGLLASTLGEEVLRLDWVGSGGCCPRQPRACVNQWFLFSRGCPMMDDHLKGGEHVLPGVAATRFEWCRASPKSWTGRGERDLGEQVSLKTTEGVSAAWFGSSSGGPEPGGTAGGGMLGWGEEGIFLGPCPDQSLDGLKNKGSRHSASA